MSSLKQRHKYYLCFGVIILKSINASRGCLGGTHKFPLCVLFHVFGCQIAVLFVKVLPEVLKIQQIEKIYLRMFPIYPR